jgi:hypothetical protein
MIYPGLLNEVSNNTHIIKHIKETPHLGLIIYNTFENEHKHCDNNASINFDGGYFEKINYSC